MHALDDVAFGIVLERDDALQPEDVRAEGLGDLLDPREEALGVELAGAERDAADAGLRDVVVMLVVMVVIVVVIMIMIVVMMVVVVMCRPRGSPGRG